MYTQDFLKQKAAHVLDVLRNPTESDDNKGHLHMENWEWPTGVALYGIWKTYQQTNEDAPLTFLIEWYERWLSKSETVHRNVNTVCPMLALANLYTHTKNAEYLPHIVSWADWVMNTRPRTEFGGLQHITVWNRHWQQLWADTLFMTCLFLLKAGQILDRKDYIEEAKYQFLIHAKYLQEQRSGLLTHGWTFDMRNSFAGAHWARGNAWFTAAAAEMLSQFDDHTDASLRMIKSCLQDQIHALWKLQRESGLYTTLMDVEETYEETSATAGIAYGTLRAVRLGYVSESYREMGQKAAAAVIGKIAPDGTVMGVSGGTGMGHDLDFYKKIKQVPTAYGQGLTFLMLTELLLAE
jgi:unsaturated rhamnogalacturonyl hydrolase